MAQNREKEETELKVPETLALCSNPIVAPPAKLAVSDEKIGVSDEKIFSSARSPAERPDPKVLTTVDSRSSSGSSPEKTETTPVVKPGVNRCSGCKRKVGLFGFRCRCGEMFCSDHRYSDRHDCSYDYKAAGREAIARENPVVRAAKILKV